MRTIAAVASIIAASAALAADGVRTGRAAYGDWRSDAPGVQRLITPADLPPPYATNRPHVAVRLCPFKFFLCHCFFPL